MNNILTDINNNKLADVLTFLPGLEQKKIVSKLYDGTPHIQTVGFPTRHAEVELFAKRTELEALNLSEASGELLQITYRDTTYLGYIESPIQWTPIIKGEAYEGKMKFLIEG